MFCTNCGAQNPDGTRFCTGCGAPLTGEQPEQPLYGAPACDPPMQEHPVVGQVKRFVTSPLFLVTVILFTLSILLSMASSFTAGSEYKKGAKKMVREFKGWLEDAGVEDTDDLDEFIEEIDLYNAVEKSAGFSIPVFPILTAVGLWMLFAACKQRNTPIVKTGGLKMVRIVTKIQYVLAVVGISLGLVSLILTTVLFTVKKDDIDLPEELSWIFKTQIENLSAIVTGILIGTVVALVIVLVFVILYYSKLLKSMDTVKGTLETGVPSDRISGFAAVLVILSGASTLSNLTTIIQYFPDTLLIISTVVSAAATVLFGVLMFRYRSKMRELMMGTAPQQYNYYG